MYSVSLIYVFVNSILHLATVKSYMNIYIYKYIYIYLYMLYLLFQSMAYRCLKLVSHQTISPPIFFQVVGEFWVSHQQINPPTKIQKSVGAYITLNIKIISFQIFQIENLTTFTSGGNRA